MIVLCVLISACTGSRTVTHEIKHTSSVNASTKEDRRAIKLEEPLGVETKPLHTRRPRSGVDLGRAGELRLREVSVTRDDITIVTDSASFKFAAPVPGEVLTIRDDPDKDVAGFLSGKAEAEEIKIRVDDLNLPRQEGFLTRVKGMVNWLVGLFVLVIGLLATYSIIRRKSKYAAVRYND